MIDPTCGSGHFLIGAFKRPFARWQQHEPGTEVTVLAQRTLGLTPHGNFNRPLTSSYDPSVHLLRR